jgi:hypothetical protein
MFLRKNYVIPSGFGLLCKFFFNLFKRTFAANFADVHGLTKKNSCEFAKSVATVLFFPLKTVEP